MDFKESFVLAFLYLSNDDIISYEPGLCLRNRFLEPEQAHLNTRRDYAAATCCSDRVTLCVPTLDPYGPVLIIALEFTFRGGTPLYKPYRYVPLTPTPPPPPPTQRVWFLRRFGQKTGLDFVYFGLESGMVFKETTDVYKYIYQNRKER